MLFEAKNFGNLLGVKGFSDKMLKNHFTLYQGYVANTNKLVESLGIMVKEGKTGTPEFAELKRRFGWEFNGMRLHEYYFGNIAKSHTPLDKESALFKKFTEDFGSYETWETAFRAAGAMRGVGWAALYYDTEAKRLLNVWINEHDKGHLVGAVPILIMDVFEHAYMTDYGIKRGEYIDAFFKAIDWKAVAERFEKASKIVL